MTWAEAVPSQTNRRDAGLVRLVGPWGLAASIVCSVVGAGIFAVPASLAAAIGAYAPVALLVCAAAIGAVTICFAEGGSRVASSGGAYGYIEAAFGPMVGFTAGMVLWISNLLASAGLSSAIADVVASVLPAQFRTPGRFLVIVGTIAAIAAINLGGVKRGMGLVSAVTLMKLIPLAVFVVFGLSAVHAGNLLPSAGSKLDGLGRALILALFAFTGMEVSLCASGECARPAQTIPRALGIALLSVTLIYLAVQLVAQGILGHALASSPAPLADAMQLISPVLRALMLAGAALSMIGFLSCDLLASPRLLFAFSRDGFLPGPLGRLNPTSHAPSTAIVVYAILAVALGVSGTFAELAVLSTLTVAVVYIAGCLAAWRLARNGTEKAGTPLNFRLIGAASVAGTASMLLMIALASRQEVIGLVVLVAISAGVYLLRSRVVAAT